jgi:hypothetical protein
MTEDNDSWNGVPRVASSAGRQTKLPEFVAVVDATKHSVEQHHRRKESIDSST